MLLDSLISVPLAFTAGLPLDRTYTVKLPTARSFWNDINEFEVRSNIRKKPDFKSELICDLTPFFDMVFIDADTVLVKLHMTGNDTRTIDAGGFYDVILSDPGTADDRVYPIAKGPAKRSTLTTAGV